MTILKNNIKIYIKVAPTCFGTGTPSSGSALFVLAKVTLVKSQLWFIGGDVVAYTSRSLLVCVCVCVELFGK